MKSRNQDSYTLLAIFCAAALLVAQPCIALMITEVMFHPVEDDGTPGGEETLEFIELYNNRAIVEDISGYAFTNGVNYTFPSGTTIGAKEYLVIAKDPAAVETAYGITGVYGPFASGSLDNNGERIELSNANGEIIISFRYNDGPPWYPSTDGTGHSLTLARFSGDPEESSSWAPSTYIGGTPGAMDPMHFRPTPPPPPPPPTLKPLVLLGHAGRYFKGAKEPSPGAGDQATTDWTQIDYDLNPYPDEWLEGPSGYGYDRSSAGSERPYIGTYLDDMEGNYWSVYARLEFNVTQQQLSDYAELQAEVRYDDGYVLYLNGERVAASPEIGGQPPAFDQPGASSGSDPAPARITLPMQLLVVGKNVLAIQAHNVKLSGSSDCLASPSLWGAIPGEPDPDPDPQPDPNDMPKERLLINELLTNSESGGGLDWVEVYNPGPVAMHLSNVYLSDGRFDLVDNYRFPDGLILQPGEFASVDQAALGFGLSSTGGETVFLTLASDDPQPIPLRVFDAVRFGTVEADITLGRYPNGDDNIVALSSPTRAASNAQPLARDIVINEIMYHHGSRDPRYEYIEIYNRSNSPVPLTGWAFTDGVDYEFPPGTVIGAHSYIVIANDPAFLATVYNNLTIGVNLFGPYNGGLDDHSERIRLSLPAVEIDPDTQKPYPITADEVTFYDGGRWPIWADGQGSSLELIDPDSNNDSPDAWTASDDTGKTQWEQFSFTIDAGNSDYTHDTINIFSLMMLNRGDVLIDDLELTIGGSNRLSNAGFESGESPWRILGNHVQSFVTTEDSHSGSRALHIRATGHGDPGANRINQSIADVTAGTVTFRGWARWLRGSRYMLLRTSRELSPVQPPRPTYDYELTMPMNQGTPGEQNTAYMPNRGPDIDCIKHDPVLPQGFEPIVVTAQVADNDGIASVILHYRSEGETVFTAVNMTDDGSADDMVATDGIYTAAIPGTSGGNIRAFYIEASDGSAMTRFPTRLEDTADVPDRTCLVRVGDLELSTQFATYRIWMSNDVVNTFTSRANLSNELMDCTFVYNETEVFYNAKLRHRGSPFLRNGSGRAPTPGNRRGYRIDFNSDQKFGSREEINLDGTEGSGRGPLQERASYWFYRKMGLQYSMQEYMRPIMNGRTHSTYEDVQKIDGDYVDGWFPDDNDGYVHKVDDYFEYNASGTSHRNKDEGLIYNSSHPLLKETYRWGFEKRSHRENDEWGHLLHFAEMMNTPVSSPDYEANIESVIDPMHFAKVIAIRHAVGDWDSYGYNRGKNNLFYYAPVEGKWYLLPWDIDFTLGSGSGATANLFSVAGHFPEVRAFLNYGKYRRMYQQALAELVSGPWRTSHGTANPPTEFDTFLDNAANARIADGLGGQAFIDRWNAIKAFVGARRSYILEQIPPLDFQITTNEGLDFCAAEGEVTLKGSAPLEVSQITVNGTLAAAEFSGNNVFSVTVAVEVGANVFNLQGLNSMGNPVAGATDSIGVDGVPACSVVSVTPSTVCTGQTVQLTVHGTGFEPGSVTSVKLANASDEIGFDALYVKGSATINHINAATAYLDDPSSGVGDEVEAVHTTINLLYTGSDGVFSPSDPFAAPYNSGDVVDFAVRFTGYIYAPSAGVRYLGVNSDDGFRLSFDLNGDGDWTDAGELVGEYAAPRGAATTMMSFSFPAEGGYYMVLDFYERGGGEEIEFFQADDLAGSNPQLINDGSELVVFRDDVTRINTTSVVVQDENTIICLANLTAVTPDIWNVIVTPECGEASKCEAVDVLRIVDPPVGTIDWTVSYSSQDSAGHQGGPFAPDKHNYLIRNWGTAKLDWSVAKGAPAQWLDLPATPYGTLNSGGLAAVSAMINSVADTLGPGTYTCPLIFSVGCPPGSGPGTQRWDVQMLAAYRSDFNLDKTVDFADLKNLADAWLDPCSQPDYCGGIDLDQSTGVGLGDLAIFAGEWLRSVP